MVSMFIPNSSKQDGIPTQVKDLSLKDLLSYDQRSSGLCLPDRNRAVVRSESYHRTNVRRYNGHRRVTQEYVWVISLNGIQVGVGIDDDIQILTATSTVFSCPTRLISEVHVLRFLTAATKTNPLLFIALDAVICAPSGDQL